MAGENTARLKYTAGVPAAPNAGSIYVLVWKPDMSQVFNGSLGVFQDYDNGSNRDSQGVRVTEVNTGDSEHFYYFSNSGELLASATYPCIWYVQSGLEMAEGDEQIGVGEIGPQPASQLFAEADLVVDKTTNPLAWDLVWYKRGTATELMRKPLKDVNGDAIAATSTVIGRIQE